jgi:hypothetical protein
VACFQDLDYSKEEAFSLRKEAVRGTNYKAFTNTRTLTITPKGDTRTWGGSRRQAVLTCLNEDYFDLTKTKQRNWTQKDNTRQEAGQGGLRQSPKQDTIFTSSTSTNTPPIAPSPKERC